MTVKKSFLCSILILIILLPFQNCSQFVMNSELKLSSDSTKENNESENIPPEPGEKLKFSYPLPQSRMLNATTDITVECEPDSQVIIQGDLVSNIEQTCGSDGRLDANIELTANSGLKTINIFQTDQKPNSLEVYKVENCAPASMNSATLITRLEAEDMTLVGAATDAGTSVQFARPGRIEGSITLNTAGQIIAVARMRGQKGNNDIYFPKASLTVNGKFLAEYRSTQNVYEDFNSTNPSFRQDEPSYPSFSAGTYEATLVFSNPYPLDANSRTLEVDYIDFYHASTDCYQPPAFTGTDLSINELASFKGLEIGSAIHIGNHGRDRDYRESLAKEVQWLTPEYGMKQADISVAENQMNYNTSDQIVAAAKAMEKNLRGHTLVWHRALPPWIEAANYNSMQMENYLNQYITAVVTRYKDDIKVWDVVNEALFGGGNFRNSVWFNALGESFIDISFQAARNADPDAKLFYNDFWLIEENEKTDSVYSLLEAALGRDVPIDGIGIQVHIQDENVVSLGRLKSALQKFADLGLEIHITEMDYPLDLPASQADLNKQAEMYMKVAKACASIQNCTVFSMWGITDKYSVRNQGNQGSALLLDVDFNPKPSYRALQEYLYGIMN